MKQQGNRMDLSVLVPGIRTHNWEALYNSIPISTERSWEMIFVGPSPPSPELSDKDNVQFIQDYGTPIRCQQIGLIHAQGVWITWAADDGYFLESALDVGFDTLDEHGRNENIVVMGKYFEGEGNETTMSNNDYYLLNHHEATRSSFIPDSFLGLNVGLVSKSTLYKLGGWDCQFEVCPMAHADTAFRLQQYGTNFIPQDRIMFKCGHMPGITGDHGPVHYAQILHDEPLYKSIYGSEACLNRKFIDINNWKNCPSKWERRFGR